MTYDAILISARLPTQEPINLGVLVLDRANDCIHTRFRADFAFAPLQDAEVIAGLQETLERMATDTGGMELVRWLEDIASNTVEVGERFTIEAKDFADALNQSFQKVFA